MDFPDLANFGMEPALGGQLISARVDSDDGSRVSGQFMQYPDGRIGGLTLGEEGGLDDGDVHDLTVLIERCAQGNWHLSGLRNASPDGSFAKALVVDAIAACAERAA